MTGAAWLGGCAAASCILCPQPLPVTFRGDKRFCHLSHKVAERGAKPSPPASCRAGITGPR